MTTTDNDLDKLLHQRFSDAMNEIGRSDRRTQTTVGPHESAMTRRSRFSRRVQFAAVLVGVFALGVVPAYAAGRASAPTLRASRAQPSSTAAASVGSPLIVQKAISWALSAAHTEVLSLSRIEVKLVTYKDFSRVWGDSVGACNQGSDAHVVNGTEYVVAMSGNFVVPSSPPQPLPLGATPPPAPTPPFTTTTHYAMLFIPTDPRLFPDAATRFSIANVNMPGDWPPCFDMLTDVQQ
jgi:hypothetical protein